MSETATATLEVPGATKASGRPWWKDTLEPYSEPRLGRSLLDLATSVVPYVALSVLMYLALDVSYLITLALAVPAAGFLVRVYILFHDCTHGSLFSSKKANTWVGSALGLLVFSPFLSWRHNHQVHHATAGDLDRRGIGDVPTKTVSEYYGGSRKERIEYRLIRNPLVMFGIGPILSMIVLPRIVSKDARPRIKRAVIWTNVALVLLIGALCFLMGWKEYLLVQAPTAMIAGAAGVFLFYVQHQFEDVYWESSDQWSYADAALRGSSYFKLPKVLQFFSGNIGLHHVHHLSARIPNYNLQAAHDDNPVFHDVPTLTLWDGLKTVRLKLWDEERGRLVGWAEAKRSPSGEDRRAALATPQPEAA